ncbi:hypothetical protein EGI11_11415 [Chryseobacterium sp. H3056]|uniref:Uncharacterized protein n=1 Tax=Kaistella daneshvariae TaxID=2487074 RepID=A0A3N0WTF1_9FLAO|nr:hypothetical protein EGI11_11415 [Kaistella daneshvariae]
MIEKREKRKEKRKKYRNSGEKIYSKFSNFRKGKKCQIIAGNFWWKFTIEKLKKMLKERRKNLQQIFIIFGK